MSRERYSWRPGSRIRIDPQAAGREMEDVRKAHGGDLTPETVLERAHSANSALHGHFEWDDSEAAVQYRLVQASELIRSIVVDVSRSNLSTKEVRAFVSVERGSERSYTSITDAMSDPILRKQVVQRAWAEFDALRKRHAGLKELASIFEAISRSRPAA